MPNGTLSDLVFRVREISSGRSDLLSMLADGRREALSTADYLRGVHSLALALETRGLVKGEPVAIFAENRPEWHIVDFACQLLGAPTVALDPSVDRQRVGFMLRNSGSKWIFYGNGDKRDVLLSLQPTLTAPPELAAFDGSAKVPGGTTVTRLMGEGAARIGEVPIERFRGRVVEDDLATLTYTRGASGDPTRVEQSHRERIAGVRALGEIFELSAADRSLSRLPLAHDFQRTLDHLCFYRGAAMHYVPSIDEMPEALRREQPTVLAAPPEVYERVYQRAHDDLLHSRPAGRRIFRWAIGVGERYATVGSRGFVGPLLALQRKLADVLVLRGIRQHFGGHLRLLLSGDGQVAPEIRGFYQALGIPLAMASGCAPTVGGVNGGEDPPP